ncbi:MAG: S1 RNA-binding domain-containing protein, partial [Chloroflexota bacterium]
MIDETNRATAGATEAPTPEPGDDPLPAQDSAEQPAAEGVARVPATDEGPTDAARTGDETPTASSTEADAPAASADDATALTAEPDAPQALTAEPHEDEPATVAISVDQAPVTFEPSADEAAEPATAAIEAPAEPEEPMTMAQLMESPDNEVKSLKHGDVVEGTVVRIDPDEILVDFGGKSEGVVSNRELMSRRGPRDGEESRPELSVGDEVLVYVLQPESPEGHAVLSLRRAGLERKWRAMQERFEAGEIVEARVIDH